MLFVKVLLLLCFSFKFEIKLFINFSFLILNFKKSKIPYNVNKQNNKRKDLLFINAIK